MDHGPTLRPGYRIGTRIAGKEYWLTNERLATDLPDRAMFLVSNATAYAIAADENASGVWPGHFVWHAKPHFTPQED
jgi:hypothetical protein